MSLRVLLAGWILVMIGSRGPAAEVCPAEGLPGRPAQPAWVQTLDGAVLVAWEQRDAAAADLYVRRVETRRRSAPAVRLDPGPPGAAESLEPRIAVSGSSVLAAWQDAHGGTPHIRVRRSTNGGKTWAAGATAAEATVVSGRAPLAPGSPSPAPATMPALAMRGREAWIAWEDRRDGARDIFLARSTDAGATWLPPERAESDAPGAAASFHPQLAALADGALLLLWWDERNGLADLFVRRSPDGGATWPEPETRLDPGPAGSARSHGALLRAGAKSITIVWDEDSPDGRLARTSTDGGLTWSAPARPTDADAPAATTRVEIVETNGRPELRIVRGARPAASSASPAEK